MDPNIAAYLTRDVNAFAMADGTIRVYSGLLDLMTDDEVRYVMIGHEIGHVALGRVKSATKAACATTASQNNMAPAAMMS